LLDQSIMLAIGGWPSAVTAAPPGDPGNHAAVDRYRRLRGEPPLDLASLAEAVHWTRVHGEMLRFSERTCLQADRVLEQVSPDPGRS
jgi:hypothetical protein